MPQIIPIRDLRNTNELSDRCHAKQEPIFVTKNGYGDLVVMSIETYDKMLERFEIDAAIAESEKEITDGAGLIDARDALSALRVKHLG